MSGIRILGLAVGFIGIVFTFLYYRGIKWKRNNFIFLFLFNSLLITISANPDTLNILRDMLAFKTTERGRLIALLILSVIFLLVFVFYLKSKLDFHAYQFDILVRAVGEQWMESDKLKQNIKPLMIVIPSYNEADNLLELIPKLPKAVNGQEVGVLVIDDGSSDHTRGIAQSLDCIVVRNFINRGQGAALRLGYDICINQNVQFCVTMDADNQHRPEDIPALLEPLIKKEADLVIGSRVLGENFNNNKFRNSGLTLFNFLISRLLKSHITDCSSGFRGIALDVLKSVKLLEIQYQSTELIIEAVKKGYRIKEVPITITERKHGESKKGTNIKYALNFFKVILKTWWR